MKTATIVEQKTAEHWHPRTGAVHGRQFRVTYSDKPGYSIYTRKKDAILGSANLGYFPEFK